MAQLGKEPEPQRRAASELQMEALQQLRLRWQTLMEQ